MHGGCYFVVVVRLGSKLIVFSGCFTLALRADSLLKASGILPLLTRDFCRFFLSLCRSRALRSTSFDQLAVCTKGSHLQLAGVPSCMQPARAAYCRPRAASDSLASGAPELL